MSSRLGTYCLCVVLGLAQGGDSSLPSLAGYRLGTVRSSFPRDLPCTILNACQPTDSTTLYFGGGKRVGMIVVSWEHETGGLTPLEFWRRRVRPWVNAELGEADSVNYSLDEINVVWRRSKVWRGEATVKLDEQPPEQMYVLVRLFCIGRTQWCQDFTRP